MANKKLKKIEIELETITKHDFFFEKPLYNEIDSNLIEEDFYSGNVDAYNHILKDNTTYQIERHSLSYFVGGNYVRTGTFYINEYFIYILKCSRRNNSIYIFTKEKDEKIEKVGQYPSLADIHFAEIDKEYCKALKSEDLSNLKKAIGLNAHGIGAGAFIYLRRIFENLITETFLKNKDSAGLSDEDFGKKRMQEKITAISDFLPKQLLQMTPLYSILSKGVHELSEEECLNYFSILKSAIIAILKNDIKIKKEKDDEEDLIKEIQKINKYIK